MSRDEGPLLLSLLDVSPNKEDSMEHTGFRDLSNLTKSSKTHKKNEDHLSSLTALSLLGKVHDPLRLYNRGSNTMRKSNTIENTLNTEHHVHAILFLATQSLAFRGHDKSQDSFHRGNFVKLLKNFQYYSGNKRLAECLFKPTHPTFSGLSSDI